MSHATLEASSAKLANRTHPSAKFMAGCFTRSQCLALSCVGQLLQMPSPGSRLYDMWLATWNIQRLRSCFVSLSELRLTAQLTEPHGLVKSERLGCRLSWGSGTGRVQWVEPFETISSILGKRVRNYSAFLEQLALLQLLVCFSGVLRAEPYHRHRHRVKTGPIF